MSEQLARALLPRDLESARRSPTRPAPTADLVDRALLVAAALLSAAALLLLWHCLTWGL